MEYERVVALASGTCIKIDNSLKTNVRSIAFELENNKKYEDHISIYNERELVIDGTVYSDNNRVVIKNPIIKDKAVDLVFNINTVELTDGDVIEGVLSVVCNIGVLNIPFKYSIISSNVEKVVKKLETISDYYNYLSEDFDEAKMLFTNKLFLRTPFMQNEFAMSLYEGLCKSSNLSIAMLEFFKAFEIDITKFFENDMDEIIRKYIDDSYIDSNMYDGSIYGNENATKRSKTFDELASIINEESEKEDEQIDTILEETSALVESIRDKDLLNILASMCVRNNYIDSIAFKIYLRVIEKGSSISGIYDKFFISIPENYKYKLPLYIYRLYFEDKSYSFEDKLRLYDNIISAFDESEDVYKLYSNEILEYAISMIYQNRITESLIKIYNKVLSIGMINENNYNNVLYLLRSHKLILSNSDIRKVIIKYNETEKETKYDVINNIAYVPIFFGSYIMLYEDVYGNRYYNENVSIKVLFDRKDLENYIIEKFPQKDIVDMTKIIKLNESERLNNEFEIEEIKKLEKNIKINIVIKNKFISKIIDFYYETIMNGGSLSDTAVAYIKNMSFENLSDIERTKLLKILLNCGEYKFVFEKVSFYGLDYMQNDDLIKLFTNCTEFKEEQIKLKLLNDVFTFTKTKQKDMRLLAYLSNNYDGSIENLVFLLDSLVEFNIDTRLITKKILMLCLECNDTKYLDHIYSIYEKNGSEDNDLNIAYLNKKATDYMLDDVETADDYFDKLTKYLTENFEQLEELPIIFLLAITKYVSNFKSLNDNTLRRILIKAVKRLLDADYVFAYFKKLIKFVPIPYEIMNKEYIEFHADRDFVPKVILSISGYDEKKEVELTKVFMNIYVKRVTVFKNEIINYEIINSNDPSSGVLKRGTLSYDENYELEFPITGKMRSTYDYINDAIVCLDRDNIEGLKKVITEMTEKQEVSKEWFNI